MRRVELPDGLSFEFSLTVSEERSTPQVVAYLAQCETLIAAQLVEETKMYKSLLGVEKYIP